MIKIPRAFTSVLSLYFINLWIFINWSGREQCFKYISITRFSYEKIVLIKIYLIRFASSAIRVTFSICGINYKSLWAQLLQKLQLNFNNVGFIEFNARTCERNIFPRNSYIHKFVERGSQGDPDDQKGSKTLFNWFLA